MHKIKILAATVACAFLIGCGSSMPGCEDQEVITLLKDIAKEQDVELVKLSAISTKSKNDTSCRCTALATMRSDEGQEDVPIQYEIDLADNGNEFSVVMSLR